MKKAGKNFNNKNGNRIFIGAVNMRKALWWFWVGGAAGSYCILHCIFASGDLNYKFLASSDTEQQYIELITIVNF